ncbi:MAG: hypothetical protein ACT4QF_23745 [Sporichthyaceae bacterium]
MRLRRPGSAHTDLCPCAAARLERPLSVEDLARQATMSSRNLARHHGRTAKS